MSLEQWRANAWITPHVPSPTEIQQFLDAADRDLTDAAASPLSDDWRFAIAYNAGLQLATAALHASGYRAARGQSHHLRALQSLEYTIALDRAAVEELDRARAKRHVDIYEKV